MLIPNHGLGYLAGALKRDGHDPMVIDCIRDTLSPQQFLETIRNHHPDVIGFQVYTFDLPILQEYIDRLQHEKITIIAGGPHPSADPHSFAHQFPEIDFFFRGEADLGLPRLIHLLHNNTIDESALRSIPGLVWRSGQSIQLNPCAYPDDLDTLGFPDWDQISPLSYPVAPQGTFTKRLPYAPIIVTRGCPYPCSFCAGKLMSGRKIRSRTADHVISELRFLVDRYGIREFHIQDDNFTFHREFVLEFCRKLQESRLDLAWACPNGIRLDSLDPEVLHAMESAGCYSVAVGIESGSQRILDLMQKRASLADLCAKVHLIRKTTAWYLTGFFILGYPGETEEEIKSTIRLSKKLPLDKANFGILMPLPGTVAAIEAEKWGWTPGENQTRMSEYRSQFISQGISPGKFRWLFRWAFISFYARPRIIYRFISQIKSWDQIKILWNRLKDVILP